MPASADGNEAAELSQNFRICDDFIAFSSQSEYVRMHPSWIRERPTRRANSSMG